ncbi:MAG: SufD family Fe-S cluster assembly protein [Treponema sp.]|jgi:Fe-S cluster assembly scaffold protein SufB|nr:SufD family Fe-S cluster assembly protein [Treponema sp.]
MAESLKINKLVSPSWSWLKINEAEIDFDFSLENIFPEIKNGQNFISYENCGGLKKDFPELLSGTGKSSDSIFENSVPMEISIPENVKIEEPIVLNYDFSEKNYALTSQIIVAGENSEATVIIVSSSEKNAAGFQALRTEVYAKPNSKIRIVKVQLLGGEFVQVDDTAAYAVENSEIELTHVELGASKVYVGAGCNLKEYKGSFKSNLGYYLKNEQFLDMNFLVNHFGKKTSCKMKVAGSLNDNAKKTYRGTIDFKTGSAGSDGDEQEETLLLSPDVVNNSMPIILCTEEDISGEHGATIGRLSDEILFYMESRGISRENAEKIIARAKVQAVSSTINDEETVKKINDEMNAIFGEE